MTPDATFTQYYQTVTEQIKLKQSKLINDPTKQLLDHFRQLNKSIHKKLQYYNRLTEQYLQKVEKSFLISFSKILQRMGNDLMLAEQAYKNIDKEIMMKEQCVNLNQDKIFFINQSTYYKNQFQFKVKELEKVRENNFVLVKQNTGLKQKLFEKTKQNIFLKEQCKKLQKMTKFNSVQLHPTRQNFQKPLQTKISPQIIPKSQTITTKFHTTDKSSKKWSLLGKQTAEQRRKKQVQHEKQKKNLFVDIRQHLKTREKINLDMIVNRSFVDQKEKQSWESDYEKVAMFRTGKPKANKKDNDGFYTLRVSGVNAQEEEHNKSSLYSTIASNMLSPQNNGGIVVQRNLHTSGDRNTRKKQ